MGLLTVTQTHGTESTRALPGSCGPRGAPMWTWRSCCWLCCEQLSPLSGRLTSWVRLACKQGKISDPSQLLTYLCWSSKKSVAQILGELLKSSTQERWTCHSVFSGHINGYTRARSKEVIDSSRASCLVLRRRQTRLWPCEDSREISHLEKQLKETATFN